MLLGTDQSGENVFIVTEAQLVAQDKDNQMDVYDVRVDGGYPAPDPLPLQCEGDACHNPTNPPNDPTPSSSVYEGPGNEHLALPVEQGSTRGIISSGAGRTEVSGIEVTATEVAVECSQGLSQPQWISGEGNVNPKR